MTLGVPLKFLNMSFLNKKQLFLAGVLLFISIILFLQNYRYNNFINETYRQDYLDALWALKNSSKPKDIVLAEWTEGNQIVSLTGRRVIATSKVYPSEAKEIADRYRDLANFFFAKEDKDAGKILSKYDVSFLFIRKDFDYRSSCKIPKKLCQENGSEISRLIENKSHLHLIVVFESDNFIVYKVIK